MEYTEAKISKFRDCVLRDAYEKRDDILNEVNETKKEFMDKSEHEALVDIYAVLQNKRTQLRRRRGETVTRVLGDSKKNLIKKREEIMNKTFERLAEKVDAFRSSDGYKSYVMSMVEDGLKAVGEGDCIICIDIKDSALLPEIKQRFGIDAQTAEIMGGCKVINPEKNIICDNCLEEKICELKETFFEDAGLDI